MLDFFKESKNVILAILSGALPAILWLWFWLKQEDDEDPEPIGLIILSFIVGCLMVLLAIWMEKFSLNFIGNNSNLQIIVWVEIIAICKL